MPPSFHDLQWAVSHNSYNTAQQKVVTNLPFDVGRFYDLGFRGVELDIVQQDTNVEEWCVCHGAEFDTRTYKLLSSYLTDVRDWSMAAGNRNHDPIFVHLDCKDVEVDPNFPNMLDDYLRHYLGDQALYTSGDVITAGKDLMQSAMTGVGWASPDDLPGRLIIFILTGERQPKEQYAANSPATRLCFADIDLHFAFNTNDGTRLVANGDAALVNDGPTFGSWCHSKQGVLWRLYVAETLADFNENCSYGVNMVAADPGFRLPKKGYWKNPLA